MNLKQIIAFYEERVRLLTIDYDNIEYEAAPSGEVNESMIPANLILTEIATIEEILDDLKYLKYEKPRRSFHTKRRKIK